MTGLGRGNDGGFATVAGMGERRALLILGSRVRGNDGALLILGPRVRGNDGVLQWSRERGMPTALRPVHPLPPRFAGTPFNSPSERGRGRHRLREGERSRRGHRLPEMLFDGD